MAETTAYHVSVQYDVTDRASKALGEIDRTAKRAAQSSDSLKRTLLAVGGAVVGGRAFSAGKSALVDFNASLEDSRVLMAGLLQLNVGGAWERNMDRATQSVDRFQQMAKVSALTTKDLVDMASMIERPLLQAGVSMRSMEDLTFGAANAAMAFGINASVAAFDIEQALNGTLTKRDRFMQSLLMQKGIGVSNKQYNAMSAQKRVEVLQKALRSPAITKMAEAQSQTWHGVTSTLKDNLEMAIGKVGLPLFKAITAEVRRWNTWLDSNQSKVQKFSDTVAKGLVSGFNAVKNAFAWIYDHSEQLIAIGKVYAAIKIGSMLGGGFGAFGFSPGKDGLRTQLKGGALGISGKDLLGNAGNLLASAFGGYQFAKMIGLDQLGRDMGRYGLIWHSEGQKLQRQIDNVVQSMSKFDQAVLGAQDALRGKKGAQGTGAYGAMIGVSNMYAEQIDAIKDFNAGRTGQLMGSWRAGAAQRFKDAGLGDDENIFDPKYRAELLSKLEGEKTTLDRRASTAAAETDRAFEYAMNSLTDEQRQAVDESKALRKAFEIVQKALVDHNSAWGVQGEVTEAIKKLAGDEMGVGGGKQKKGGDTHIHNMKVEVAAKDPDRWLAEFDAKVSKRVRAPTRAKRAIGRGR